MLSMSTTMQSAWVSGSNCQPPPRRALASVNAAFSEVSVAGSIPVRPKVRDIVESIETGDRSVAEATASVNARPASKAGAWRHGEAQLAAAGQLTERACFFGRWLFRNAIWSARMLRLERIRCSTQLGR